MYSRYDLSPEEVAHARLLDTLCKAAAQPDMVDILSCWDEEPLAVLTRRLALIRPAPRLEDFLCIYYGDEIRERFDIDFAGKTIGDIPELSQIRQSMEAYRLVAEFRAPHISRVLRDQRSQEGVQYTRILEPIVRHGETVMVAALFVFMD